MTSETARPPASMPAGPPDDLRDETRCDAPDGPAPAASPTAASPTAEAVTAASPTAEATDVELLEHEGDIAADYLEGLLDIADLDGDIDMDVEGSRAAVSITGGDLGQLVGREGEVLEALQELTRLAVYASTGRRSRLMLDIAGHRQRRREALAELGRRTVAQVRAAGQPVTLEPMTPFERKVIHDVVSAQGLRSESEGEEPQRRVVVLPA